MNSQIICTLIAFTVVIVVCPFLLPFLRKLKFGQVVRQLGPEGHYKKAGTPTMGGIAIVLAVIVACTFYLKKASGNLIFAVVVMVIFAIIGFLDDFIKMVQKNAIVSDKGLSMASLGMKAKHKIILQFAVAAAIAVYVAYHPNIGTDILIPFTDIYWQLGRWFIPFVIFTVIAVVNAVNLTDGLDGLAAGVTLIVCIFFFIAAMGNGMKDIGLFMASVIGACLGFLCYNFNPAKVFMGDTGSLSLGAAVVTAAVFTKTELFILLAGAIYVIEAMSVILQISYYKISHGKRIFKMAPIHHHFELCGWEETRIVTVFWIFSAVCVLISFMALDIYIF